MDVAEGIVIGLLLVLSIFDMRMKKVPVWLIGLAAGVALIFRMVESVPVLQLLAGLLPGIFVLLLAVCTKESIGTGDGLVLCALGLFCSLKETVAVLGMALFFAAVVAVVLLVLKRAGRKTELPFLPCLCTGYLLCVLW